MLMAGQTDPKNFENQRTGNLVRWGSSGGHLDFCSKPHSVTLMRELSAI